MDDNTIRLGESINILKSWNLAIAKISTLCKSHTLIKWLRGKCLFHIEIVNVIHIFLAQSYMNYNLPTSQFVLVFPCLCLIFVATLKFNMKTSIFSLRLEMERQYLFMASFHGIVALVTLLCSKHTSGRWSLATCIGQPACLQHDVRNVICMLVGQYRSTDYQKYVLGISLPILN